MSRKPETLKIGGHTVKVVFAETWKGCEDKMGEWDDVENTIYIRSNLSPTMQFTTLIHEMLHVCNSTIDHTLLDSLAEQVGQFLLDNDLSKPIQ